MSELKNVIIEIVKDIVKFHNTNPNLQPMTKGTGGGRVNGNKLLKTPGAYKMEQIEKKRRMLLSC